MIVYDILKVLDPFVKINLVKPETILYEGTKANVSFYFTQLKVKDIDIIECEKETILCMRV